MDFILDAKELDRILAVLQLAPWRDVNDLIQKLLAQANNQPLRGGTPNPDANLVP
jgi:hypothetical protein